MFWVKNNNKNGILLQSIKYNWKNIVILIQDGILYTSSRLVGTSVEDFEVHLKSLHLLSNY